MRYKSATASALKKSGVKPSDIRAKVGGSLQAVYNWVNGVSVPRPRDIPLIAAAAGINADRLAALAESDRARVRKARKHAR